MYRLGEKKQQYYYDFGEIEEQNDIDSDESNDDEDCIFADVGHESEEDNILT